MSMPAFSSGLPDEARDRRAGLRLVMRLQGLLRTARLYQETNLAYRQQRDELFSALRETADDETTLVCMAGSFFLNGARLKPPPAQSALFRALQDEFESRGLSALRFLPDLGPEELSAFLRLFAAARTIEQGERLPEAAAEAGITRIMAVRTRDLGSLAKGLEEAHEPARDEHDRARETFSRAVRGTRALFHRTAQTGRPAIRQARHVVQPVVDGILRNEYSLIGLTAMKAYDEYTYAHCVNVSVLAVAMGAALGLPRPALANLGVAGLLHDLGKLAIPPEVLHKPGRLDQNEWDQMRRHPFEGVKLVVRLPGLSRLTFDVMRVTLEHHRHVDGGGYPAVEGSRPMLALSRIVAVADCYDAMTAHRSYRARPFTGREALEQLAGPEGLHHDPAALWALIRSVGVYPAGTVMRTYSGHVVLSVSPSSDVHRPRCRVLAWPDGHVADDTSPPVYWEPMPADEGVDEVLSPEQYPVPVEPLLAA